MQANRDAVGSKVTVVTGDHRQTAEIHSGRSYQSHYGTRLHFGLGGQRQIDRIEIRWHGGRTQILENQPLNRLYTIIQPAD